MSGASHTCCARVYQPGRLRSEVCGRSAKIERSGRWYCGRHDPVAEEARQAKRDAKFKARYEADRVAALVKQQRELVGELAQLLFEQGTALPETLENEVQKLRALKAQQRGDA